MEWSFLKNQELFFWGRGQSLGYRSWVCTSSCRTKWIRARNGSMHRNYLTSMYFIRVTHTLEVGRGGLVTTSSCKRSTYPFMSDTADIALLSRINISLKLLLTDFIAKQITISIKILLVVTTLGQCTYQSAVHLSVLIFIAACRMSTLSCYR